MTDYVEAVEILDPRQFCGAIVTPYRAGFEHARMGVYGNSYAGLRRAEYDQGHEDGRNSVAVAAAEWTPAGVVMQ